MFKKLICFILIIKLTQARYAYLPKFYGQDSAIIIDANKPPPINNNVALNYRNKMTLHPPFPLWRHYPRYHIIPPPSSPAQIFSLNSWAKMANKRYSTTSSTTTTTTTTTTPRPTIVYMTSPTLVADDEFPRELLDIAQNKLGLKSLDEIPSISELGQLLGTSTTQETLHYIKKLSSNKQGIALMKAYIESADYTDNSGDLDNKNQDDQDEEEDLISDIDGPVKDNDSDLVVVSDEDSNNDYDLETTTLKSQTIPAIVQKLKENSQTHQSFFERVANFMHLNNLFDKKPAEHQQREINENYDHERTRIIEMDETSNKEMKTVVNDILENQNESEMVQEPETNSNYNLKAPILVRDSIPYNYPVPIRIESSTTTTTIPPPLTNSNNNNTSVVANESYDHELTRKIEMDETSNKEMKTVVNDILENQNESEMVQEPETSNNYNVKAPILVRDSIPYNYPVPIRIPSSTTTTTIPPPLMNSNNNNTSVVHLNTPKILLPHVQQLARFTKIPTKKIEHLLASKPKLLELANRVSRFPIDYGRNSPVESQVMAAIQKAIEQDEDLRKLSSSTPTLK